jgi:hypothetical protein
MMNLHAATSLAEDLSLDLIDIYGAGPQLPLSSSYKVATSSCAAWTNERIIERTNK